jgi:hypothetical protein
MIRAAKDKIEFENQINIFYETIRVIAGPYFEKYGFSCKVYRGKTTASFEKK